MLERAQEGVRRGEGLAVLAPDVATPGQRVERAEGRGTAELPVGPSVHQLQELDGELDVTQPAGAELELAVGLAGGDVVDHAPAHRLHVADEAVALRDLPHHRLDELEERLPELEVAGDRTGLEQRLELPRLGPALVVGTVAREGADQRAGLALGAQVGVDRPDRALDGVLGADLHQLGGQLARRRGRQSPRRRPRPARRRRGRRRRRRS